MKVYCPRSPIKAIVHGFVGFGNFDLVFHKFCGGVAAETVATGAIV